MTLIPPPERTLPDRDGVLARVLAGDVPEPATTRRARWVVPLSCLAAAGVVAAAVVGVEAVRPDQGVSVAPAAGGSSTGTTAPPSGASASGSSSSSATASASVTASASGSASGAAPGGSAALVTGPLTAKETREVTRGCATTFGIRVKSTAHERFVEVGGAFPHRLLTVVVTATDGSRWGCSARAGDMQYVDGGLLGSKTNPSRTPPRVSLGVSGGVDGKPGTPDFVEASGWAVVPPNAVSVRARWSVNGRPLEWTSTAPVDGFAYVVIDLTAPLSVGDVIGSQAQALDASGRVLIQSADVKVKVVRQNGVEGLEPVF